MTKTYKSTMLFHSDVVEDIQLIPNELFLNCIDTDSMELMSIPSFFL
jgi:hypothetical protein